MYLTCSLLILSCDQTDSPQVRDERITDAELSTARIKKSSQDSYVFGFDLRSSPQEDARQYLPFLNYLEKKTGHRFELHFTSSDGDIVDDLGKGIVHFAAVGATSTILAKKKYGVRPVVLGVNKKGLAKYRSYFITQLNSEIDSISKLRGKKVAFGSITSTQGHLIPRIILEDHNIKLEDLESYSYQGSHSKCADEVVSGRADACGLQDTMAESLAADKLIKILHKSRYYPSSGIAASTTIPDSVIEKVKKALLDFKPNGRDADELYDWDKSEMPNGFVSASMTDYLELDEWLNKLNIMK